VSIQFLGPPQLIKRTPHGAQNEERVSNWIRTWDFTEVIDVGLVGVAFGKGGEIAYGTDRSPNALRKALVRATTYSHDFGVDMRRLRVRHAGDVQHHVTDIERSHQQIESALAELNSWTPPVFIVVVGGDGSIVAPAVRALARGRSLRLGLLDFDAYHDVRETAEVGPSDATSIRRLLGDGVIQGRNLAQLGLHGFANAAADRAYLEAEGATLISARQIRREGLDAAIERALARVADGVDGVYVSVDANVLDAAYAPFSYASAVGGLSAPELMEGLFRLGTDERVRGLDLVGLDTYDDPKELMARLGVSLLLSFLAGFSTRPGVGRPEDGR
jgi:formiminoglutamase